jgi:hypothetical protein
MTALIQSRNLIVVASQRGNETNRHRGHLGYVDERWVCNGQSSFIDMA